MGHRKEPGGRLKQRLLKLLSQEDNFKGERSVVDVGPVPIPFRTGTEGFITLGHRQVGKRGEMDPRTRRDHQEGPPEGALTGIWRRDTSSTISAIVLN